MNKKAGNPITLFFMVIIGIVVYGMFAGERLNYWTQKIIIDNNLTGLEAFLWGNFQVIILGIILIFIIAWVYIGE